MRILIIGHARHGKDTVAEMIEKYFGLTFKSSSVAASKIFLYDALKDKYGYMSPEECFEDRVNHRAEWKDLITEYNQDDRARLAREILKDNEMYVGMRDDREVVKCLQDGLFDWVIGVYNPNLPEEPKDSFDIDIWDKADFVIPNAGTLEDLDNKVWKTMFKITR